MPKHDFLSLKALSFIVAENGLNHKLPVIASLHQFEINYCINLKKIHDLSKNDILFSLTAENK